MPANNISWYEKLSMLSQLVFLKKCCFGMLANNIISCYEELSMLSQLVFLKYAMLWPEFVFLRFYIEMLEVNSYFFF